LPGYLTGQVSYVSKVNWTPYLLITFLAARKMTAELICMSSDMYNFWIMAAVSILLVFFLQMTHTIEQSALYRNPTGGFSFVNFKPSPFHYLWTEKITSFMVDDQFDCIFLCVAEAKCYSVNVAAYPDSKGLYLCELLATDKYRKTETFQVNATFHHYSPWVRYSNFFPFRSGCRFVLPFFMRCGWFYFAASRTVCTEHIILRLHNKSVELFF